MVKASSENDLNYRATGNREGRTIVSNHNVKVVCFQLELQIIFNIKITVNSTFFNS